jgi:hypothetical protein
VPELNKAEFDLIVKLIKARKPAIDAARIILVNGGSSAEACITTGLSAQSLCNTLARYRNTHAAICSVYRTKK